MKYLGREEIKISSMSSLLDPLTFGPLCLALCFFRPSDFRDADLGAGGAYPPTLSMPAGLLESAWALLI